MLGLFDYSCCYFYLLFFLSAYVAPLMLIPSFLITLALFLASSAEPERRFSVSEAVPIGSLIGFVNERPVADPSRPNFYVVYPNEQSRAEKVSKFMQIFNQCLSC